MLPRFTPRKGILWGLGLQQGGLLLTAAVTGSSSTSRGIAVLH